MKSSTPGDVFDAAKTAVKRYYEISKRDRSRLNASGVSLSEACLILFLQIRSAENALDPQRQQGGHIKEHRD